MLERRPRGVARDDVVDAMAAAVTAAAGDAALRTLPTRPPRDTCGLPMEMLYIDTVAAPQGVVLERDAMRLRVECDHRFPVNPVAHGRAVSRLDSGRQTAIDRHPPNARPRRRTPAPIVAQLAPEATLDQSAQRRSRFRGPLLRGNEEIVRELDGGLHVVHRIPDWWSTPLRRDIDDAGGAPPVRGAAGSVQCPQIQSKKLIATRMMDL